MTKETGPVAICAAFPVHENHCAIIAPGRQRHWFWAELIFCIFSEHFICKMSPCSFAAHGCHTDSRAAANPQLTCGSIRSASNAAVSFRVMSFIEKSVARLDQQDRLEALALELGKSHYHYNAPPKYYNVRPPMTPCPPTCVNSVMWCERLDISHLYSSMSEQNSSVPCSPSWRSSGLLS